MNKQAKQALVVGAGPAGLMAADVLGRAGWSVFVADAKPSIARKFLMAGKSGLNLTKDVPLDAFLRAYDGSCAALVRQAVREFGPQAVADWARALGQPVFTGSSGRVFPSAMKASPLLRAWIGTLQGVEIRTRWRWVGFDGADQCFDTPEGPARIAPDATVLALGGASWARLGSDGGWAGHLDAQGVKCTPFAPANAGLSVVWSDLMARHFGAPVKVARLTAGGTSVRGEFVVSRNGLEGSAIYAVSRAVRNGAALTLDLCPDWTQEEVARRLARPRGKATLSAHLRKSLRLDPVRLALLREFAGPLPSELAPIVKALPVRHAGLRPLDEAISTAGGVAGEALDGYRIRGAQNVYACGEMLDWEAPTGGYLLTACFATGRAAAQQVLGQT